GHQARTLRRREILDLPELDQHPVGAARMHESGLFTVAGVEAIDDAHAVTLHRRQDGVEIVDFDRQVMQALAALVEKTRDEAVRARRFDELELEAPDVEVTPVELVGVAGPLLDVYLDRQTTPEKSEGRIDVTHG